MKKNKTFSEKIQDAVKEIKQIIIFISIILILAILYGIYIFMTEALIPFLISLFLLIAKIALSFALWRIFAHLVAYLTLKKRYRWKIRVCSEKSHDSMRGKSLSNKECRTRPVNKTQKMKRNCNDWRESKKSKKTKGKKRHLYWQTIYQIVWMG